jgi:hypothetical protein
LHIKESEYGVAKHFPVSVAICSAIFSAKLKTNLPAEIMKAGLAAGVSSGTLPSVIAAIASQNSDALSTFGLSPEQLAAVQQGALEGYAKSYPYVFYVIMSGVACIIVGECTRFYSLLAG